MLFMTTLIIGTFCFSFYLLWNQFLKKETRLSTGLKVLQKKLDMVEKFAHQTDMTFQKRELLLNKKQKEIEKAINEARFCIFKMEKLQDTITNKPTEQTQPSAEQPIRLVDTDKEVDIKKSDTEQETPNHFNFGESPFLELQFIDKEKDSKEEDPSLDIST